MQQRKKSDEQAQAKLAADAKPRFDALIKLAKDKLAIYRSNSFYGWIPFWFKEHSPKVNYLLSKFAVLEKQPGGKATLVDSKDDADLSIALKLVCLVAELQFSKLRYENKIAHVYDFSSNDDKGPHIVDYKDENARDTETHPEVVSQKNSPNKHFFYKSLCNIVDSKEFKDCFTFIDTNHLHHAHRTRLTALLGIIKDKPYSVFDNQVLTICKARNNG